MDPLIARWDLGSGETSVLSYARQNSGYEAIVDDRAARKCARALQIPVRGTLGVVLLARRMGKVAAARPIITELQRAGLRVDAKTVEIILELSGE